MDELAIRPWYRIHRSTLAVLSVVIAWLVFINVPGDRITVNSYRFYHGWPYHYFERVGTEHSFWSFAGTGTEFHAKALLLNSLTAFCIAALLACACELWIRRNGRLFRFGIRSLMTLTALFAAIMGLGVREVHRCYRQQYVLQELARFGSVTARRHVRKYDWFRSLFGAYSHGTIERVELVAVQPIDRLPDLRALEDVEGIGLEMSNVPENIEQLAELGKLKYLGVELASIDKADFQGLTLLTEIPQLHHLSLHGDDFGDADILRLSLDARIEMLGIKSSKITERSLVRLSQLKSLKYLTLDANVIQSEDCSVLCRLPGLSYLAFVGDNLTAKDEEKLRALWPNAQVDSGVTQDTGQKFIRMRESTDMGSYFFH